jgi:hypothetical protein
VLRLLAAVLVEAEFWLVAAFVLGALYPYLRGPNGVIKGVTLATTYIIARGISALVESWISREAIAPLTAVFTVRAWLLLLFLVVVGLLVDGWTLRHHGHPWRDLYDLYQLRSVRGVALYLSPLVIAVLGTIQQLQAGHAQEAITEVIKTLPQAIPGAPGTPGG